MKKRILFSIFITSCLVVGTPLRADTSEALPRSWYMLPEDVEAPQPVSDERYQEEKAGQGLERILKSSTAALESYSAKALRNSDPARKEWSLRALILDLSVSVSGMIGVMMAKGEASAALYWRPKTDRVVNASVEASPEEPVDMRIRGTDTRAEIISRMEPIIRASMTTGEIKNEKAFRKNLLDVVLGYQELVQDYQMDPGREWVASKLRLDFTVDISGKVMPTFTVGGGVRLRFEWEPCEGDAPHKPNRYAHSNRAIGDNLKKLINTLSNEMRQVSYDSLTPTGFAVKSLKFGLGIYGEAKFGIVKAGVNVMGHLYLTRRAVFHPIEFKPSELEDSIPLIDNKAEEKHLVYADSIGVRHDSWKFGEASGTVYSVPKGAFQKGIEKTIKIGTFMAERAKRSDGKRWELYLLKTEFVLSLGGSVGIVSIGGQGALEIAFDRA